jgi:uncharacterized protein (TIGR02600 family)
MALVVVLASLVILVGLAVAFLSNAGTELKASKSFAEGGRAEVLAESAVNIVKAQIALGTRGVDQSGNPLAWASQPGMIRTYDDDGNPEAAYKLYSWDVMNHSGGFDTTAAQEQVPASWFEQKGVFVDLNEPITLGNTKRYPIIDGNGLTNGASAFYDADGDNAPDIEGFTVKNAPKPVSQADPNPVPMPVKWLYVLKDGTMVTPVFADGVARFDGPDAPSAGNPIVGRVAFWTDDETAKVNVNVASEGVHWDTPRSVSEQEDYYKMNQPVGGEYQRYPGHPAMTSLSTIFKKPASSELTDAQWAQMIYELVPRVRDGGSQAGTVNTAWAASTAPLAITPDNDRLYASVDELLFKPDRGANALAYESNEPAEEDKIITPELLEKAKFFLTTSSRAPDLNLFNLPRVCNWPITLDKSTGAPVMTPYDRLIAFCTTMRLDRGDSAYRYYFQRQNPDSATADLPGNGGLQGLARNRMLLEYLRDLLGKNIPGVGGSFVDKYRDDAHQILVELFDYIRSSTNLMDRTIAPEKWYTNGIPNYGLAPWRGRHGEGQVVPIEDVGAPVSGGVRGLGRYPTLQGASILFIGQIDGDDPVQPELGVETSQVDLVTGLPLSPAQAVPPGHMRIQAMVIPQFFNPAVGVPWQIGNFQWSADLSQLKWGPNDAAVNPIPMVFPNGDVQRIQNQKSQDETGFGDQYGLLQIKDAKLVSGGNGMLVSLSYDVPKLDGQFNFGGGKVTFKIYATERSANPPESTDVIQTVEMFFEQAILPLPKLAPNAVIRWNGTNPTSEKWNYRVFSGGAGIYNKESPGSPIQVKGGRRETSRTATTWIVDEDVVRSVHVRHGDPRLVAALKNVGISMFDLNEKYHTDATVLGTHNLFDGYGRPYYGARLGRLVKGVEYEGYEGGISKMNGIGSNSFNLGRYSLASDVPFDGVAVGKHAAFQAGDVQGDFDNGPFTVRDGPFINKADEGDKSNDPQKDPYDWKLQDKAGSGFKDTPALFTPNRQIPSAGMFGSLPSGVLANRPWQTLLFRPEPKHPGSKGRAGDGTVSAKMPADHYLLDLFHMPVVEPYAISEPLSTAGRINMNYQIVPFTYINRETGIRALLATEKVTAIRDDEAHHYKKNYWNGAKVPSNRPQKNIRFEVNIDETLEGFRQRFEVERDIFRSASEICELHIVPSDPDFSTDTYATMEDYWETHRITGDNTKERIYTNLYPRLTTKSNTFTVHFRAQALKKVPSTPANVWDESKDQVTGEYRGHQTLERYIDPNDPDLPDYADLGTHPPISDFYKFRVVQAKQFTP